MSRTLNPQLSFADLELSRLGVHLDPVLQGIDAFLDQHSALIEHVRLDLERGLKKPGTGRNGITPSQTLRSLTLMRVKNWDYRELRERINDGYTLRGFTQFDSHLGPQHDAFNRAFNRLTPATLEAITKPWSRRPSNSVWKTARNSASIPRSWKPIFIGPPMRPCGGTRCAPSLVWSKISRTNFPRACGASPIAPAAPAAACNRSNG